ncbi:MAG: FtsW/RodA/SpoVE family cell cycle protein, partial [Acidimicrobiales bacterium]
MLVVLNLIGLVMVLSASSVTALHEHGSSWYYFKRELLYMGAGSLALVATMRFDYHRWSRLAVPVLALSIGLMVLVLVPGMGVTVNGSSRWLGFGVLQIQPSEFAKLGVLLFAADLLSRRAARLDDTRLTLRPVIVAFGVVAFLLIL